MRKLSLLAGLVVVLTCTSVFAQNLKPEDIVAKHADAIGAKGKRAEVNTVMALGMSEFEASSPVIRGGGKAVVVSDPNNLFFVISLNSREYPFDKIGYFGDKVSLPFISAGNRSILGAFLSEHPRILSEGLFGGVTSLRWPLWRGSPQALRLKGGSVKKVSDRKVYVVDYQPSSGGMSDFSIRLHFDTETFRHVRTEYRIEVQPGTATFGRQNQIATAVGTLTEEFSDFKDVGGLTLPHRHRIEFASNSNTGMYKSMWGVRVAEYRLNQKLADGFFTFEEN